MPMASICSPSLAALFSACFISKNSRGTSQQKRPASSTGSLRKAVQLADLHALAVKGPQHRPAAGSAEVESQKVA